MKKKSARIPVLSGILALLLVFSLAGNLLPGSVQAASSGELKEQLDELEAERAEREQEIAELRAQMSDNYDEMKSMVQQKNLIDQEITLLFQQQDTVNEQLSAYALLIADKQEELDAAQARLKELQIQNKARIRAMEENGGLSYWSVLFQASSFMDMLDRLEMVAEIAEADRRCLEEMDRAAREVSAVKESLEAEQLALQSTRQELEALQATLNDRRAETDELLLRMKAKDDEFHAMIEDSEALQEQLMEEIANLESEYEDAKYQEWLATYVPPETETGNGNGNTVGGTTWLVPCSYSSLTSPFGMRWHPKYGGYRMHNGIDLAGRLDTPIIASRSGYVSVADYQYGGAGNYVQINHGDGYRSIYMHMTRYIVSVGQYVEAGQVIGYMGSSGGSTGVHLHFGISYNGTYVNPVNYIFV